MNFETSACTERCEPKVESAKSILENTDTILKELGCQLRQIDDIIYSPSKSKAEPIANEPQDSCLLYTLNRQRNLAGDLLQIALHIREGLC